MAQQPDDQNSVARHRIRRAVLRGTAVVALLAVASAFALALAESLFRRP